MYMRHIEPTSADNEKGCIIFCKLTEDNKTQFAKCECKLQKVFDK